MRKKKKPLSKLGREEETLSDLSQLDKDYPQNISR